MTYRLVTITPSHINCTQHAGHSNDSTSDVKMFLRVVILVFAATCCTALVFGKSLHTRHWYTRSATDLQQMQTRSKLSLSRNKHLNYTPPWWCGGTNS